MSDEPRTDEKALFDSAWWREFTNAFLSEGVESSEQAVDAVNDGAARVESLVKDGREKLQAFLDSGRAEAQQKLHSALDDIRERLDRIEARLDDQGRD